MEDIFTIDEINDYISKHKNIVVLAEDVYNYWKDRKWLTNKKIIVPSIASVVTSYNGIVIFKDKTQKARNNRKENKEKICSEQYYIWQEYKKQLERKEWKAFREFIFAVRGKECELCRCKKGLQIHHIKYIRSRYAWEYTSKDVRVLCSICHRNTHGIKIEDE